VEGIIVNSDPMDCVSGHGRLGDFHVGILVTDIISGLGDARMLYKSVEWSNHSTFYDGVSMYDIGRRFDDDERIEQQRIEGRGGRRKYSSIVRTRRPRGLRKKDIILSDDAIAEVSTIDCCARRCVQRFPRSLMKTLRREMHCGTFKNKYAMCLDVHKRVQWGPGRKGKHVLVEGRPLCLFAWRLIFDVKYRTFLRYSSLVRQNQRSRDHGNKDHPRYREAVEQATATLRILLEGSADLSPYKSRTLEIGERVGQKVLPAGTRWNKFLDALNTVSDIFIFFCNCE